MRYALRMRIPKPQHRRRVFRLTVMLTESERRILVRAATKRGVDLADLVRSSTLGSLAPAERHDPQALP